MPSYEYRDKEGNLILTKITPDETPACSKCGSTNTKDKGSWYKCLQPNCDHYEEHAITLDEEDFKDQQPN